MARVSRVRIIGGKWRGRKLAVAPVPGLRPTPDRVRETAFNWLAGRLPGARVLDLFAGTGALGFEALSRGAAHATLVDRDAGAARLLRRHGEMLGANAAIAHADARAWLARRRDETWNVVFLDPPFGGGELAWALDAVAGLLTADGVIYAEAESDPRHPRLEAIKSARAGNVHYCLLQAREEAAG